MRSHLQPTHRLAPHVRACRSGAHVVLLDLKRDRYLGLHELDAQRLHDRVAGLPRGSPSISPATDAPRPGDQSAELLDELLAQRMLVSGAGNAEPSNATLLERPERALIEGYVEVRSDIRAHDVVSFLTASLTVAALLRWRSLEQIMGRVWRRRARDVGSEFDFDRAQQRFTVFDRLRPFIYSAGDACLFSSLVAHEFLARYHLLSHLVFGVATQPFRAHCWLQQGDVVINDTPECVREYTPILVI